MSARNLLKTHVTSITRRAALAAVLTATAGLALAGTTYADGSSLHGARLQGTWRVTVVTYNCADPWLASQPFASYVTFGADGTLVETTSNPAFRPGQRSAGHGFWRRLGLNFYRAVSEAFVQFPSGGPDGTPGSRRGHQRIDQGIQLTSRNSFESEATTTFFDTTGAPYFAGCARATGERLD